MERWRRDCRRLAKGIALLAAAGMVLAGCGDAGSKNGGAASAGVAPTPGASAVTQPKGEPVELLVSAAASLTESLNEIKKLYEAKEPNVKLTFNYGASGTLQQQIEQGAPADLFLSAGKKQMDALVEKNLIEPGTNKNLLGNELVVITSSGSKLAVEGLQDLTKPEFKKLGVGTPESVPAGSYAKEALTSAKLWEALQDKLVLTKDVKQVISYVETGNTEAGFVYKTDALASSKVKIAFTVDPKTFKPIEYPIGIVKATKAKPEAEKLYRYLATKEAMDVFVKYGFTTPK
ncbi:molybdate ABC transporter substrate-binding protein [Gorillibacterium sp. sgz5001074]|uniref:molybdate ABC transporter substrate-binding protein n=1 Tax=Gorillibacterium sp. sgz5001074 TaxID=3446695 RepID=UPI003F67359D